MGKFYFAFAWDIIVNLHVCICKNKICIWSDPGVNLPICKYTPVCICVRMRHLLTPSKICTPEYIYTCVFLAHANWTLDAFLVHRQQNTGKYWDVSRQKQLAPRASPLRKTMCLSPDLLVPGRRVLRSRDPCDR